MLQKSNLSKAQCCKRPLLAPRMARVRGWGTRASRMSMQASIGAVHALGDGGRIAHSRSARRLRNSGLLSLLCLLWDP